MVHGLYQTKAIDSDDMSRGSEEGMGSKVDVDVDVDIDGWYYVIRVCASTESSLATWSA